MPGEGLPRHVDRRRLTGNNQEIGRYPCDVCGRLRVRHAVDICPGCGAVVCDICMEYQKHGDTQEEVGHVAAEHPWTDR